MSLVLGVPENGNDLLFLYLPKLSFASIIVQSICGDEVAGNPDPPSSRSCISQKIVDLLSSPAIVHHLKEKLGEESSSVLLSEYNARVMLSLFNKLDCWVSCLDYGHGKIMLLFTIVFLLNLASMLVQFRMMLCMLRFSGLK